MRSFGVLLALALPAAATDLDQTRLNDQLRACYEAAADNDGRRTCLGQVADTCMSEIDGGQTNRGIVLCLQAETNAWDGLLNAEYTQSMRWAQSRDVEEAKAFPEHATLAVSLRSAQRAWLAFRDAECALAYAQWGAGSIRFVAGATCLRNITADRTIALRVLREQIK